MAKPVAISRLAWYAADPESFARHRGKARSRQAVAHGNKAHHRVGRAPKAVRIQRALIWLGALFLMVAALILVSGVAWAADDTDFSPSIVGFSVLILSLLTMVWLRAAPGRDVCRRFGLSPWRYRTIGSDLGARKGVYLRGRGIVGMPDALLQKRLGLARIVGEFKTRSLGRSSVQRTERYQVVLYLGLQARWWRKVSGVLVYGDGAKRQIEHDAELFERLVALAPEVRQALATGRAPNPVPLHRRGEGCVFND